MPDVSLAALALRLGISMGVVIALMLIAAKLLRRAQAYAAGSSGARTPRRRPVRTPISVGAITPLGRGASVAVVRAAGRELVLGVTEQQITLLHSGIEPRDPDDPDDLDVPDDLSDLADLADLPDVPARAGSDHPTPGAARIAALVPHLPQDAGTGGASAWMAALETMRTRTARR